jgi:hypothetical protein
MNPIEVGRIIECLWPRGDKPTDPQVYAILDGARDRRIEPMMRLGGLEYCCLYGGRLSPRLQAAAPYVIHLARGARFTRELLELGWGNSWGIFTVVSPDFTLQAHRRHFRTLLRVRDESGRILVFRFYDPRVLRAYLSDCTKTEAHQVFGSIPRIVFEGAAPTTVMAYTHVATTRVLRKDISMQGSSGGSYPGYEDLSVQANFKREIFCVSAVESPDQMPLHQS